MLRQNFIRKATIVCCVFFAFLAGMIVLNSAAKVNAAGNPYPSSQTVGGVETIPCTRYAWQQAYDRLGIELPAWGNAINWLTGAIKSGYSTGTTPAANSIAVWSISSHSYGHVAFVTSISGNRMIVNEGGRTDYASKSRGIVNGQDLPSTVGTTWGDRTLVGFVYLTQAPQPELTGAIQLNKFYMINADNVPVYATPSTSGVIQSLRMTKGSIVYFSEKGQNADGSTWYHVADDSGEGACRYQGDVHGYVEGKYISEVPATGEFVIHEDMTITVAIRESPSANSAKIVKLNAGNRFSVSKVQGGWGYTSYGGKSGWMRLGYCRYVGAIAPVTYTVSYNANGGAGAPGSQTKTHGTPLTLSAVKPTLQGRSFLGWATSSTATNATYTAGGTYTSDANVVLYAVWRNNTYTVTFNANGGAGAPRSQTKTYGKALTLPSAKPTRTNYTFLGWATSSTATSAIYAAGGAFTTNITNNITLYAVWGKNQCGNNDHKWNAGIQESAPTCTMIGRKVFTCQNCGVIKEETISSLGHSWDNGKITKNATENETGILTYTCTACSETKTETISKTNNSKEETILADEDLEEVDNEDESEEIDENTLEDFSDESDENLKDTANNEAQGKEKDNKLDWLVYFIGGITVGLLGLVVFLIVDRKKQKAN